MKRKLRTKRTEDLHFRLEPEMLGDIDFAAAKHDIPISAFVRLAIKFYLFANPEYRRPEQDEKGKPE